jgi:Glycosyltransferase family 87/WD40-like Beta Propeller Repeat
MVGTIETTKRENSSSRGFALLAMGEWLVLLVLLALFIRGALLPGWRILNTDFPNYYLTAALRLDDRASVDRAYEWIWFQRHKDHHEIDQPVVGYVPNPPLCAAPLLPIASLPALTAKRLWIVLNLALLAGTLWILHRVTLLPWRRVLLIAGLCVLPLRTNFNFGQYYILILFLMCLAYYSIRRGHRFTAGAWLAAAAWFKLFPAVFLLLFLRKREWRAISGLLAGLILLGALSVLIFGLDMHRVWLVEVLPRALRGDLVGPYVLKWSSFTSLWHRLFLFEPELNPTPVINSIRLYATAQALTGTALLFAFLFSADRTGGEPDISERTTAWEWSAFVPLLLLLSSMPGPYHYCVLIFSAVLGVDFFLRIGQWRVALLLGILYALACASLPEQGDFALRRLLATFAFYVVLLWHAPAKQDIAARRLLVVPAIVLLATLIAFNLRPLRSRAEDFSHRMAANTGSYASSNPAATKRGIVSIEMFGDGYKAVNRADGQVMQMPSSGDVLSLAGSEQSPFIYFELVNRRSQILRLASAKASSSGTVAEYFSEGQQPAISNDGRWVAFLRVDHGRTTVWMSRDGAPPQAVPGGRQTDGGQHMDDVLEMTVTAEGSIIAAVGDAANPHLSLLRISGEKQALADIAGAVRYPAISPDSSLLAFSRREAGSWHLYVRDLATGHERQLTSAACNATSPAWQDPHTLLYATDCGRGFGLSALAQIELEQ